VSTKSWAIQTNQRDQHQNQQNFGQNNPDQKKQPGQQDQDQQQKKAPGQNSDEEE